jgi:hypothetical protein
VKKRENFNKKKTFIKKKAMTKIDEEFDDVPLDSSMMMDSSMNLGKSTPQTGGNNFKFVYTINY